MAELTREEEAEFTAFNLAAFTLACSRAAKNGLRQAAWLCTHPGVKAKFRAALCENLRGAQLYAVPDSEIEAELNRNPPLMQGVVDGWKRAELDLKTRREAGDQGAHLFELLARAPLDPVDLHLTLREISTAFDEIKAGLEAEGYSDRVKRAFEEFRSGLRLITDRFAPK